MKIFPAIDILNHSAVRLTKGDFETATTYFADPVKVAVEFAKNGVRNLHVVDLDGARSGRSVNASIIADIIKKTNLRLQAGGGLRTLDEAKRLIDMGVEKIIVGSIAVKDPATTTKFFRAFGPERITLAVDCQECESENPQIAINGWQTNSTRSLWDLLDYYINEGVSRVLCTDIERDGVRCGANVDLYRKVLTKYPGLNLQASGGIATLAELSELARAGMESCVIGKSLYEGAFSIQSALTTAGVTC
jgi:phosphoribosylformimino-5-aminoimidazole carboxamide ribotide isomerase